MTDFVDEARTRAARLIRMAATEDTRLRDQLRQYAASTPDPPLMGSDGIQTTGCPQCRNTMWRQRDLWVCAACGHVKDTTS
ncbi:hypothetical protein ACH44C_33685 [Streptomyces purpureus]|uniref:hypothetical protein n=1 Tax=Streptomyces purpureus TaxID=1951 RepID=UPI0037A7C107